MSALNIIVGSWLVLNAVVFAALMLRRDHPVLRDRLFRWVVGDGRRRPVSIGAELQDYAPSITPAEMHNAARLVEDRLAAIAKETLEKPSLLPPEPERDDLLARARRADTASHLDGWAKSRELQPPE